MYKIGGNFSLLGLPLLKSQDSIRDGDAEIVDTQLSLSLSLNLRCLLLAGVLDGVFNFGQWVGFLEFWMAFSKFCGLESWTTRAQLRRPRLCAQPRRRRLCTLPLYF